MSKYEDYSEVSKVYDKERKAMGADVIAGLLHVHGGKPFKDLHILDAGCGTGNYAKALIDLGVRKITLMDGSKDMLGVAKNKLKNEIDNKIIDQVVEAKMPPLPFEDGSFDVVLFSLVLHHLNDSCSGEVYPVMEDIFLETKRVLRPRGIMIIITCLPTAKDVCWYAKLHKGLVDRYVKMFPTTKQYLDMFDKCGFECRTKLNLLGADLHKDYYDAVGPLKKEWRKGDSLFGFATNEEIQEIEMCMQKMKGNNTLEQFMRENDRVLDVGLLTLLVCTAL